jgi:hypothetical protein
MVLRMLWPVEVHPGLPVDPGGQVPIGMIPDFRWRELDGPDPNYKG